MRKIEFRGQTESGEWVYGYYYRVQNDDTTYCHYIITDTTRHIANCFQTVYSVKEGSIGQYTGMGDRDGTKVYEGDIIQCGWGVSSEVRWERGEGRWGRFCEGRFELLGGLTTGHQLKWYTIVGNTLDNPELILNKPITNK